MYIWRNKNRRDKRNQLLLGEKGWTKASDDRDHEADDELLRFAHEQKHIEYFQDRIRSLMEIYLDTPAGKHEIVILRRDLELYRLNNDDILLDVDRVAREKEEMLISMKELFRRFGSNEYEEITRDGLKNLLGHLQMTMSESQFQQYCTKCGFSSDRETITFQEFYDGKRLLHFCLHTLYHWLIAPLCIFCPLLYTQNS